MAVKTYSKKRDGNVYLSPHFQVKEFACKDGSDTIKINTALITALEKLYDRLDCRAINITSGYRTPSHSAAVGGYRTDQHTKGNAADITCKKKDGSLFSSNQICCALEDMNHNGGVGRINKTYAVHVDVRGYKCWFDETNGEKTTNSWYDYLGIQKPEKAPAPEKAPEPEKPSSVPAPADGRGDVDGDGKITTADAREALRAAVELEELTDEQKKKADLDGDGKVTTSDAREILRKATGLD